ncbi:MAG TPA: permease-like cell division protein FtsX [Methylomirabilota bacterium]|jgi:cell division protein FtsX|nr:permease-like cell division protein FtsX [Methylomirabilota bacterium]
MVEPRPAVTVPVLRAAVRDLRRTGAAGASAVLLGALAVFVLGATLLGLEAFGRLTAAWQADLRIVALLRADPGRAESPVRVLPAIRVLPGVAAVRFISAADALAELRRYLGPAAAGLDRLPVNPVPARVEVTPALPATAAGLRALVDTLGRLPGVEEVQAAIGWVEPAERVEHGLRRVGLTLGSLLALGAVVAIAAATGVAAQRQAAEGRGWSPLLVQAVVQGSAGAALGWSALVLVSEAGAPGAAAWLRAALGLVPLPTPGWPLGAALLSGGAVLGLVGGLGGLGGPRR